MLKIKSERYKVNKNIYILNALSFKDQTSLYKYMPYSRFVGSVRNEELVFVLPSLWIDPFERRFWTLKNEIETLIKDCDVRQSKLYVDHKPLKSS